MAKHESTLAEFLVYHATVNDLRPSSIEQLEIAARKFCEWCGKPVRLCDLTDDLINDWIGAMKAEQTLSHTTVANRRRAIVTLWNSAFRFSWIDTRPRFIRKTRVDPTIVRAWDAADVNRLVKLAELIPERHPDCSCLWADWWVALISTAWDSALRLGDVWNIRTEDVDEKGVLVTRQQKTGWPVFHQLSDTTLDAIARTYLAPRKFIFVWPFCRREFFKKFKKLVDSAGLTQGTSKWLRRGSATAVEMANPGAAASHLGHRSPGMWLRYVDQSKLVGGRPRAPALETRAKRINREFCGANGVDAEGGAA